VKSDQISYFPIYHDKGLTSNEVCFFSMQGNLRYRLYASGEHCAFCFRPSVRVTSMMRYDTTNNLVLERCGSGVLSPSHPKSMFQNDLRNPFYMRDVHSQCIGVNVDACIGPSAYKFTVMPYLPSSRAGNLLVMVTLSRMPTSGLR
jgi:hypothetical protein